MITLKLTAIGNSVGVILPKEALTALKLEKGDTVYLTESPEGYRLTPNATKRPHLESPGERGSGVDSTTLSPNPSPARGRGE